MELKEGYKQTEVGVIPEDWNAKPLMSICTMKSGEGITSANIYEGAKYPCYGGNGLRGHTHNSTHEGHYALIGRQGALCGNVLGVQGRFFASEHAIVVTPSTETDIEWLTYILGRMNLNQYSESSAQPGLSVNKLLPLVLLLPPTKAEQTAIATALSDADALIQSLKKLIAKKRLIKQGAMQELLKPREGWVVKKLGEIAARITTGKLDANAMVENGEYRFYTCAKEFYRIDCFAFNAEALLVSGNGANVGYIHYYKGKFNAYQRTYVLTDFSEDIFYAKLYMDSYLKNRIVAEVNAGNTPYIKMDTLTDMIIHIPKQKEEQTRIATILSDMDAEISAIETNLAKYKQIKQGMMQNLLTGKIRLV